ncbi:MAG: hypothetical protein K0U12_02250 [Gammaproteobacteria bacterium]|nr:hypothetical protein [Gammaproteobacteria bacterium]
MLKEDLARLEQLIKEAKNLEPQRRQELQQLAKELRAELETLAKTERNQAQSISSYAKLAAHESLREDQDNELHELSTTGLKASIRKLEASHPDLTRIIQQICLAFGV